MARLNINGLPRDVEVEADTPLLWVIREQVGLTGTKYGCGVAQCGACSVHINDEVQRSCSIRVADVSPSDRIVTIEGLSSDRSHPVQKAWASLDVPQCGYCQSGQIMAAAAGTGTGSMPPRASAPAWDTMSCSAMPHSTKRSGKRSRNGISPQSR